MYKHETILYWSNEDEAFIAEAPELPGCMAHGADQETALGNIKDAIQFWIDRAQELGRPVPEPKGERQTLARLVPCKRHTTPPGLVRDD